jgi:hypothetical protein
MSEYIYIESELCKALGKLLLANINILFSFRTFIKVDTITQISYRLFASNSTRII